MLRKYCSANNSSLTMSPRFFSFSTCSLVSMGVFLVPHHVHILEDLPGCAGLREAWEVILFAKILLNFKNAIGLPSFFQLYYLNLHLFCSKHEDYRRKQVLFGKHLPTVLLSRTRIRAHQRVFVFCLHPSPRLKTN